MKTSLICKCGSSNYTVKAKGTAHQAYCNACGKFIGNVRHDEPRLYVGCYKGVAIRNIDNANYLAWALENLKITTAVKDAIQQQIQSLKLIQR